MGAFDISFDDLELDNYISHYGKGHDDNPPGPGSGRYAWGTGERLHQHEWDVYSRYRKYKAAGMTDAEIAKAMGFFVTDKDGNPIIDSKTGEPKLNVSAMKAEKQIATNVIKNDQYNEVLRLREEINPKTGKPYTDTAIAEIMGLKSESTVRSIVNTGQKGNANKTFNVADTLKDAVDSKGMIDVGAGTELLLGDGISPDRVKTSLEMLKKEGYNVYIIPFRQLGSADGQNTNMKVLCPPGMTYSEAFKNRLAIKSLDGEGSALQVLNTMGGIDPTRVSLDRVKVIFDEEGGSDRDGMIQIRGVRDENGNLVAACPDLSIGNAKYAQVRIATEGDHYIKGMAVYSEDLPAGIDIQVNSNKSITKGKEGALKTMNMVKDDDGNDVVSKVNPFGSATIQTTYVDPKTGETKLSAINIVGAPTKDNSDAHVEGRWGDWSRNLPSQFLGKQSLGLVQQQLKLKVKEMEDQYAEIQSLNNPVVKKKMLKDFSDECDAAAVELKAAPIGGQSTHVILPVKSLKDTEVYAPNFANGTTVALVRFPHAGPFEIATVKVNNNNKEAQSFMKNAKDAIGINSTTAAKLSGADFDGDTVIVIPMTRKNSSGEIVKVNNIKAEDYLPKLKGFNPTAEYGVDNPNMPTKTVNGKKVPAYKVMNEDYKQKQMGIASNLITDMYAKGCQDKEELSRAVRWSMVVIDAKKHELNYEQAKKDLGIDELHKKYQGKESGGASSLLSRASSPKDVPARQQGYKIDEETGEKIFRAPTVTEKTKREPVYVTAPAGYTYKDSEGKIHKSKYLIGDDGKKVVSTYTGKIVKGSDGTYSYDPGEGRQVWQNGKTVARTTTTTKMYDAKDARELLSANPTAIEKAYADYANHMKTMGNEARKASVKVTLPKADPEAKKAYATEVASLQAKLVEAKKHAVKERQALVVATAIVNAETQKNPDIDSEHRKKLKGQAMKMARESLGGTKTRVTFTEREWEAVNHNAVSPSFLSQLLDNADSDNYTKLALPKTDKIGTTKRNRMKALYAAGWTQEEIAKAVGVSQSSVSAVLS